MRILHVASFVGNVGDNASHMGLHYLLRKFFGSYEVERLEIRKFYKNYLGPDKKTFDFNFVKYAGQFDLLIIGGGGFLDYWVEGSASGTTIDMSPEVVIALDVPTIIYSVGCVPHRNVPFGNIEKFRVFLEAVKLNNNIRIAVRNDGSIHSLRDEIGAAYADSIPEVLDSGFFFDMPVTERPLYKEGYVAINVTDDQLQMNSKLRGEVDRDQYLQSMVAVIEHLILNKKRNVVLVPHIYSDLKAISELMSFLDDSLIRNFISVAPCVQYDDGAREVFSIYKKSSLVIASRLHANVCCLSMGVPVIGLGVLDRVRYLYDYLDVPDLCVMLDADFQRNMISKIDFILLGGKKELQSTLLEARRVTEEKFSSILFDLGWGSNDEER